MIRSVASLPGTEYKVTEKPRLKLGFHQNLIVRYLGFPTINLG